MSRCRRITALILTCCTAATAAAAEREALADPTAPPIDALRGLSRAAGLLERLGSLTQPAPLTLETLAPRQSAEPAPPSARETARTRAEEDEAAGREGFRMTVVHRDGGHARAYIDDRWHDAGATLETGRMERVAPGRLTLREGDGSTRTRQLGAAVRKVNLRPAATTNTTPEEDTP